MRKEILYCLRQTAPVACGYIFLGMAFGALLAQAGYGPVWALAVSLLVYAGSMQFVMVSLLAAGASLATVLVTTLLVNARHIFYGLGFIQKFRAMGRRMPYMVLSLTDETYSVLCSLDPPAGMDWSRCAFAISMLDHAYWVAGSVLGAALGRMLGIDLTGIDFAMTALFVVIFLEQWKGFATHVPALTGLLCALAARLLFGEDNFLLIALVAAVAVLCALRPRLEEKL